MYLHILYSMAKSENTKEDERIRKIVKEEFYNLIKKKFNKEVEKAVRKIYQDIKDEKKEKKEFERRQAISKQEKVLSLQQLILVRDSLEVYIDSHLEDGENWNRPTIILKNGRQLGFGQASHFDPDPGYFKKLGFEGYFDFYSYPMEVRNEFLKNAL